MAGRRAHHSNARRVVIGADLLAQIGPILTVKAYLRGNKLSNRVFDTYGCSRRCCLRRVGPAHRGTCARHLDRNGRVGVGLST